MTSVPPAVWQREALFRPRPPVFRTGAHPPNRPLNANDTDIEPLYQPNPLLLDTRSQAAIPLRIGSRIMGVIDIQSTRPYAFSSDDIQVLQSLADQVAVAIDNARSYELSQQLIKDLREVDQHEG